MTRSTTKATRILAAMLLVFLAVTPALANKIVIHSTGENGGYLKPDPNYVLTVAPSGVTININPYEVTFGQWVTPPPGLWWDNPVSPFNGAPAGLYVYTTKFDLTGLVPHSAVLIGSSAADDLGEIWLNGQKVADMGGRLNLAPFTIIDGLNNAHFQTGINTLEFRVNNGAYVTGILVQISGTAVALNRVPKTGGTWTPLANQPSFNPGSALLLTDGRVLVHEEPNLKNAVGNFGNWYTLSPNAYGDYVNGTWNKVASLTTLSGYCYAPLAFASAVLPDGRVIVEGGEYSIPSGCSTTTNTNKGAIYDPVADTWSKVAPPAGWSRIGDAQSVVLPIDKAFMLADCCSTAQAELPPPYDPNINPWVLTGNFKSTINDEEGWTLLPGPPDAEVVLTVGTSFGCTANNNSEMYINGYWFCIANTPTQLWDNTYHEIGPSVLRTDGTVFQAGGTTASGSGESAIFHVNTFQWAAGPKLPSDVSGNPLDIADGPAALLPNGNVLMMASPGNPAITGATFLELQYGTDQLVPQLPGTTPPPNAPSDQSYQGHMLVLPTGQIFFTDFHKDVEIYTPNDQRVDNTWRPVIKDINARAVANCYSIITAYPPPPCLTINRNSPNTLDGFQLNGMSQGAGYGDDYQDATNYPLVTVTEELPWCIQFQPNNGTSAGCPVPRVYYCRTYGHSSMGVATGNLLVSTNFDCPNLPSGFVGYLNVVANGIAGYGPVVKAVP